VRVFGFTFLAVGVTLIGLILFSLLSGYLLRCLSGNFGLVPAEFQHEDLKDHRGKHLVDAYQETRMRRAWHQR